MKENWSYLAGLIDGEGNIGVYKSISGKRKWNHRTHYHHVEVNIVNCEERLMKYLISAFGGVYYVHRRHPSMINARSSFQWMPKGRKNKETLLLSVLPYLVIKQEQAKIALEFIRLNGSPCPEKREALYLASRKLNQRGVSPTTNTLNTDKVKIESELGGDAESAPLVTADA